MSSLSPATVLRRDKFIVLGSVAAVVLLCWIYLARMASEMSAMELLTPVWTPGYFMMMFIMWVVMMVGMMLPSVTPVILLFMRVVLHSPAPDRPVLRAWLFVSAYLLAWTLFSLLVTVLQWGLVKAGLLSGYMKSLSPWLSGGIMLAAGVYQWTPLKNACLAHCRGPVDYLGSHWRPELWGAVRMGLGHGLYCIGCCWVLMALLFVGGVMNLLLVGLIMLFVLAEKLLPRGDRIGRWSGSGLVLAAVLWVWMPQGLKASEADVLSAHAEGIWSLPPTATHQRWLVIHNLGQGLETGIFHIEVLARPEGEPIWKVERVRPHMAIHREALERSLVAPLEQGAVYPEAFNDAYAAWRNEDALGGGRVCVTSVIECL